MHLAKQQRPPIERTAQARKQQKKNGVVSHTHSQGGGKSTHNKAVRVPTRQAADEVMLWLLLVSNKQNNNQDNEPVKNRWNKPFVRREQHAHTGFQTHTNSRGWRSCACLLAKGPQERHNNNAAIDATHTCTQHAREKVTRRTYGHACVRECAKGEPQKPKTQQTGHSVKKNSAITAQNVSSFFAGTRGAINNKELTQQKRQQ